jgi:hypothetical protein
VYVFLLLTWHSNSLFGNFYNFRHFSASPFSIMTTLETIDDSRISSYAPLVQPALLTSEIPLSAEAEATIRTARKDAAAILKGTDDRL